MTATSTAPAVRAGRRPAESGYEERAATYAAEIASLAPPRLLDGLLHPGTTVAEMPSGTGHFLRTYAAAGAHTVLVDSNPAMLAAARPAVRGQHLHTVCSPIQNVQQAQTGPVGLVVIPNGALNQLAADCGCEGVLAGMSRVLAPGGLLLAQLVDEVGGCGFYDPGLPNGQWTIDRRMRGLHGEELVRMRRQRHHGDLVSIDLTLAATGSVRYDHQVCIRLLGADGLRELLTAARLEVVHELAGDDDHLTELLMRPAVEGR
ncbi:methyltransferase domain-containing protein [Sphaerisporangium sp. NPDC051017]|uniref:class I SAM-dependent methyltransferase n=1 Tax=Sphaerisporangium sp. NPDC051017 TaxID=3154636 RepID=UPI00341796B3